MTMNRIFAHVPAESSTQAAPRPEPKLSKLQIRWLIRRDIQDVLRIEESDFWDFWRDEDFLRCLRQRNCIGMVVEYRERLVGFMIYELHETHVHVLKMVVDPEFRRQGVGTAMVDRLTDKLCQQRRNEIRVEVRDSNLDAHLFLKANCFRTTSVSRDYYERPNADCYTFCYRLGE